MRMFLEKCGKIFFSKMSPSFFYILLVFPLLVASILVFMDQMELEELKVRFTKALSKERVALKRKERKESFLERHSYSDPYFLDKEVEALCLLGKEKEKLESLLHHPAFPESQSIKERLKFIHENRFSFAEENIRTSAHVKEVDEKQRFPVQIDESDLKKILSLLENVPIESFLPLNQGPQIVVTDFRLKKQKTPLQTEVFELQMDLLKREFKK